MRKINKEEYDFFPKTYLLPYDRFKVGRRKRLYIVKPYYSAEGKGIKLIKNILKYPMDKKVVC